MSHFCTKTLRTLYSTQGLLDLWHNVVFKDAASQPFLLHGILAISALHLASQTTDPVLKDEHEQACHQHQTQSVSQFRVLLQDFSTLDDEFRARSRKPWPAGPAFVLSTLLVLLAFASISDNSISRLSTVETTHGAQETDSQTSKIGTTNPCQDEIHLAKSFDNLLSLLVTIRGVRTIVAAASEEIGYAESPYHQFITRIPPHFPIQMDERVARWYDTLRTTCFEELIDGPRAAEELRICVTAIDELRVTHGDMILHYEEFRAPTTGPTSSPVESHHQVRWLCRWAATASSEFLALVRERHAAALVVLAQFAFLGALGAEEWFMKNWSANSLRAIRHVLGSGPGASWIDRMEESWTGLSQIEIDAMDQED